MKRLCLLVLALAGCDRADKNAALAPEVGPADGAPVEGAPEVGPLDAGSTEAGAPPIEDGRCRALNACPCPGPACDAPAPAYTPPVTVAPSAALPPEVESQTAHNNLDVVWHDDRLFFAFRTAPSHFASPRTMLYVVSTADQQTWRFEGSFAEGTDLREPRFLSFGGQLHLYYARLGTSPAAFEPGETRVATWQGPGRFGESRLAFGGGFIPWRFVVRDGVAWLSGYLGGENIYRAEGDALTVHLLHSADGLTWGSADETTEVLRGGVSETAIELLPDGRLVAVGRNEAGDAGGFGSRICTAPAALGPDGRPAPWTCTDDARKFDSPLLLVEGETVWLIARRQVAHDGRYDLGDDDLSQAERWARYQTEYWFSPKRCALWRVDPEARAVQHVFDFPTAGDTCFASAVPLGAHRWLVYDYTSPPEAPDVTWRQGQGGPTAIYRTTLTLP